MSNSLTTLLLAVSLAALAGCGQTGPLYMPGDVQPKHKQTGIYIGTPTKQPPQAQPAGGGLVAQPQIAPVDGNGTVAQPQAEPAGSSGTAEQPQAEPAGSSGTVEPPKTTP